MPFAVVRRDTPRYTPRFELPLPFALVRSPHPLSLPDSYMDSFTPREACRAGSSPNP